jgi:hypothetical protein
MRWFAVLFILASRCLTLFADTGMQNGDLEHQLATGNMFGIMYVALAMTHGSFLSLSRLSQTRPKLIR